MALGLLLFGVSPSQTQAAAPAAPQGLITEEVFLNIGGGVTIPDLTGNDKFKNNAPDLVNYRPYFEYQASGDITVAAPSDVYNNSGARMAGYFYPPTTGDYVFFISADDGAQLFLSTDDTPANKKLIAEETGWSGNRAYTSIGGGSTVEAKNSSTYTTTQWPTKDAGSGGAKITLTKGKVYFIEALLKEGGGGDDLSVAVMDPASAIDSSMPIPGMYLSSLKSTGPVTFTTQPVSQTVDELGTAAFSVVADGTPPYSYQWTRNSANITDATNSTYSIARATVGDNGVKFACKVTGAAGSATSADAVLTVKPDTTAPTVVSTSGAQDLASVVITFSKLMDSASSQVAANYSIAGLTVSKAVLGSGDKVVTLTTSSQAEGTSYTVAINNVKDRTGTGNLIAANTKVNFTSFRFVTGSVVIKYYDSGNPGMAGAANVVATQTPTRTDVRPDAQSASWENGSNYAALLEGLFSAPETGDYTFFISSDDQSQLFLSTDASAANLGEAPVAQVTGWTNQREWAKEEGQSSANVIAITLTKSKKYFLRAYQVEGGGGDGIAIGWITPSMANDGATAPVVLPGSAFVMGVNPDNSSVTITQQPANVTGAEGKVVSFSVAATGKSDVGNNVTYQWQKNGQNIDGATGSSYTAPRLALADNGAKFQCVISVPAKSVTSDAATLTVIADTVPPVVMGAGAVKSATGWDVGVMFDEALDLASAGLKANYSLSGGTIAGVTVFTNTVDMPSVALNVSGLTAGSTYTVTVKNVADIKGNKITTITKDFTASKLTWGAVGGEEMGLGYGAGYGVVPVADNGFDLYSDGIGEWGTYDEATFVYEQITGDFDKKLRVEYQDLSSQWARAGLIARDVTNIGVDRAAQDGGAAGRYQKVHVNPQGPTLTGPGTAGNNSWEGNRRLDTGAATTSTGGGGTPKYPNAWCRMVREGQVFSIYRSDDGLNWTRNGSVDWTMTATDTSGMPSTLFVGPEFTPENGNVTDVASRGRFLAQIRNYGDSIVGYTAPVAKRDYSIGLNFGADEFPDAPSTASLGANDVAGIPGIAQKNWNNLTGAAGTVSDMKADKNGTAVTTSVKVTFTSPNTWSNLGRGETNNTFKGADRVLMTGFLDTGAPSTTTVKIENIPTDLAAGGYDVYVYAQGGVAGVADKRGGGYRVVDASTGTALTDYIKAAAAENPAGYLECKGDYAMGNYMVFKGIKAAAITVEATTANGLGLGATQRAPINAIQLVSPSTQVVNVPFSISWQKAANGLTITYEGTLQSADSAAGPFTDVAGATSPYTAPTTGTAKFFRAKK